MAVSSLKSGFEYFKLNVESWISEFTPGRGRERATALHGYEIFVEPLLKESIDSIINNGNRIELLQTKIDSMEQQLKSLQATATSLNNLSTRQQSNLGMILQAQRIRQEAQIAKEQALQSAQEAQSEADRAQVAAPDALSLQAILNRVEDALQKGKKVASSADKAIAAADKITQHVALIEESNSSASPPTQEANQQKSSSRRTKPVDPEEEQAADSEPPENLEELINVARSSADEAIKFSDEIQKIVLEVKDLASKITQDHDNWSAVKSLFSIK
jgi:hypothetical protein